MGGARVTFQGGFKYRQIEGSAAGVFRLRIAPGAQCIAQFIGERRVGQGIEIDQTACACVWPEQKIRQLGIPVYETQRHGGHLRDCGSRSVNFIRQCGDLIMELMRGMPSQGRGEPLSMPRRLVDRRPHAGQRLVVGG